MMKRLKGIALALVFMLAVTSVAMADVEVVNLSPELVQDVQLLGERNWGNAVVIDYGTDVLAFRLLRKANVKVVAEPCFIGGYGKFWCSAELTADGLAAGEQTLAWKNVPYININANDGIVRIWTGRWPGEKWESPTILEGTVTISAEATEGDIGTEEPTQSPTDDPGIEATPATTLAPTSLPAVNATPEPTPEPTAAPTAEPTPTPTPSPYTWYSHNTQGLVGLPLRDLYPDLTDKWYNVVPVDLTVQGRQAYPLVASNLFHMGMAYVDILGDSVTVTYKTPGNKWTAYLTVEDEALAWFTAPGDITAEFLENPAGEVAFGEPVSISESLNGQDVALLFICNHVTYRQPCLGDTGYLTRYWPNLPEWKEYREELMGLLERMEE